MKPNTKLTKLWEKGNWRISSHITRLGLRTCYRVEDIKSGFMDETFKPHDGVLRFDHPEQIPKNVKKALYKIIYG